MWIIWYKEVVPKSGVVMANGVSNFSIYYHLIMLITNWSLGIIEIFANKKFKIISAKCTLSYTFN